MSNAAKLLKDQKNLIPSNSPVPNRRILVVDDEPEIAEGIFRVLCPQDQKVVQLKSSRQKKTQGKTSTNEFEVVVVNSPNEAIKEIEKSLDEDNPFAMGFFDVMLGADIDGIELVGKAFQLDPRLFAVFVTAYHDRSVDAIGNFLGEEFREKWDYINKPFTEGEILQKARNATSLWDLNRLKEWQAERLEEAHQLLLSSEKSNAVAAIGRSVAHEFGNLLTHIIGHAEIAQGSENLDDVKNSLNVILKAGQTAASVLKNFRDLNSNEKQSVEYQYVSLPSVFDEALELLEFRFRRHNIKIIKENFNEVSAEINKNSIVQVFANIFINAIHALPDGGDIRISVVENNGYVDLSIRDSGQGIPKDHLEKVLEPLFTTKGSDGSGLGLAICKEIIVMEHGGDFEISNHPQGGAMVNIKLPKLREVENG